MLRFLVLSIALFTLNSHAEVTLDQALQKVKDRYSLKADHKAKRESIKAKYKQDLDGLKARTKAVREEQRDALKAVK